MKPYLRQIILPEVGLAGQKAIEKARVLIVGAGGLGTPAALYLAAAGVGQISICDGDNVQETNLHRQVLFSKEDIGRNKSQILVEKLQKQYPSVTLKAYTFFLGLEQALNLFSHYDVILDGTDNFNTKYLINDVCCLYNKPMVYGALSRFETQISVFWRGQGPCYRCLYPQAPQTKIENCAESGILGPLPGIVGAEQALETLKIILYRAQQNTENKVTTNQSLKLLTGQVKFSNFAQNENFSFKIFPRAECLCSEKNLTAHHIQKLYPEQMQIACELKGLDSEKIDIPRQCIIDVREQSEWDIYHIDQSLHWPLSRMQKGELPPLDSKQQYRLICASGKRSLMAYDCLNRSGVFNVQAFKGSVYEY